MFTHLFETIDMFTQLSETVDIVKLQIQAPHTNASPLLTYKNFHPNPSPLNIGPPSKQGNGHILGLASFTF